MINDHRHTEREVPLRRIIPKLSRGGRRRLRRRYRRERSGLVKVRILIVIPGVDFGAVGEGYIRCCFAREPAELDGALSSMREALP